MNNKVIDLTSRIFIRPKEISDYVGISKSTIYRMVQAGKFPKQVLISERCVGFRKKEVDSWMNNLTKVGEK